MRLNVRLNTGRRAGSVGTMTLLVVPLLLLIVGLVVYLGLIRDARQGTQNASDSAALAAAYALATDDLLTQDVGRAQNRITSSRNQAINLSSLNYSAGDRLNLDPNLDQDPDGDIVFGHMEFAGAGQFVVPDAKPESWVGDRINAVQITTRRNSIRAPFGGPTPSREVLARSLALLDWEVVGFKPFNDNPIPLVPIAVYTDHFGLVKNGWDTQLGQHRDHWQFNAESQTFAAGSDGIPEVVVTLGKFNSTSDAVPAIFLQLGVDSFSGTITQVERGVTRGEMEQKYPSGFVLGADNIVQVPAEFGVPSPVSPDRQLLAAALASIIESGQPRIWPLFSGMNEEDGQAVLSGWMAARLVATTSAGSGVTLVLQPAVLHHPSVVSEHRANGPLFWSKNRTVCRVRLSQ